MLGREAQPEHQVPCKRTKRPPSHFNGFTLLMTAMIVITTIFRVKVTLIIMSIILLIMAITTTTIVMTIMMIHHDNALIQPRIPGSLVVCQIIKYGHHLCCHPL